MPEIHALEALLERREQAVAQALAAGDAVAVQAAIQMRDLARRQIERAHEAEHAAQIEREAQAAAERLAALRTPPDLQALVKVYGTWDRITPEAWATFDDAMARWRERMIAGEFHAAGAGKYGRK